MPKDKHNDVYEKMCEGQGDNEPSKNPNQTKPHRDYNAIYEKQIAGSAPGEQSSDAKIVEKARTQNQTPNSIYILVDWNNQTVKRAFFTEEKARQFWQEHDQEFDIILITPR